MDFGLDMPSGGPFKQTYKRVRDPSLPRNCMESRDKFALEQSARTRGATQEAITGAEADQRACSDCRTSRLDVVLAKDQFTNFLPLGYWSARSSLTPRYAVVR